MERTPDTDEPKPDDGPLRYSLARLKKKPLVIPTCQGDVVISGEQLPGKWRVTVKMPPTDIDILPQG